LFGGQHGEPAVIRNQLKILDALHKRSRSAGRKLVLGLETFVANDDTRKILSMLYNPKTLKEALGHLVSLYVPDIPLVQENVPTSFREYVAPFIDFSLRTGAVIKPLAPASMRQKGCSRIKEWNRDVASLMKEYAGKDRILFSINGIKHFTDPTYEKISLPHILSAENPNLNLAVLIQPDSNNGDSRIKQAYHFPCESYQINGKLD